MQIKKSVDEREVCASSDHYLNLLVEGSCFSCGAIWGLSKPSEEMSEALDDEQMKHREFPSEQEIDEMYASIGYALAGSDSQNYRDAK